MITWIVITITLIVLGCITALSASKSERFSAGIWWFGGVASAAIGVISGVALLLTLV